MKQFKFTLCYPLFFLQFHAVAQPGQLDSTFNGTGLLTQSLDFYSDIAESVAVQPDGKIVVVGTKSYINYSFSILGRLLPNGQPDLSFGSNGFPSINNGFQNSHTVVLQPDGKILVGGASINPTTGIYWKLDRVKENGQRDSSFGLNGSVYPSSFGELTAVALQPDGKILVAGGGGDETGLELFRLLPDGSQDVTFGDGGHVLSLPAPFLNAHVAEGIVLQPDGKIVVPGILTSSTGGVFLLARFQANGAVDSTFGVNGLAINTSDVVYAGKTIALQADGKFLLGGIRQLAGNVKQAVLGRFTPEGLPDAGFGTNGIQTLTFGGPTFFCNDLVIQADGKIILSGTVQPNDSTPVDFAVVRCLPDGSLDTNFGNGGLASADFQGTGDFARAVALQPDGRIIVAGGVGTNGLGYNFAMARFLSGESVSIPFISSAVSGARIYPNPARDETTLEYSLDMETSVSIRLLDTRGQLLAILAEPKKMPPGNHVEHLVFPAGLPAGIYFLSCSSVSGSSSVPICLEKN